LNADEQPKQRADQQTRDDGQGEPDLESHFPCTFLSWKQLDPAMAPCAKRFELEI
jgi:hypothetical protein